MTVRPQDLGGRRGFGPVPIEQDEPVFHADWEASVIAGILTTISAGLYNVDQFREGIDELEPLSYLTLGYYGRWLHTLEVNCVQSGVFSAEDLEGRIQALASGAETPAGPERRDRRRAAEPDLFRRPQRPAHRGPAGLRRRRRVLGRELEGRRHARIPVYAQGKRGVVLHVHEAFPSPTRTGSAQGEKPEYVYSVAFAGRELWPDADEGRRSSSTCGSRISSPPSRRSAMSGEHAPGNPYAALRTRAIESLLIEKGLLSEQAVDVVVEAYGRDIGPLHGARVVARAWADPAFKGRLLEDATAAARELDVGGFVSEYVRAVENTDTRHNLVVCTLCSCYPWGFLGLPPSWYKSPEYRSRAVREPRAVLREFGVELDEATEIRVWDSSADLRYIVLPQRPGGTEGMAEDELAALVTRESMIGTGLVRPPGSGGPAEAGPSSLSSSSRTISTPTEALG